MATSDDRLITFSTVPDVTTPEELFALAIALEREAADRYALLAERMERLGDEGLAAVFRRLQREESEHGDGLEVWAMREGITAAEVTEFRWDLPETITDADFEDAGGDYLITPWRALAMAVRNEERTFALYVNLAARAEDPAVRHYAEGMAREELAHVALLRLARRRAWREQRAEAPTMDAVHGRPATLADLRRFIRTAERDAAARHEREAERLRTAAGDAATVDLLEDLAARERDHAAAYGAEGEALVPPIIEEARTMLFAEVRWAGDIYDTLMAVAEKARDEAVVRTAQEHAEWAVARLALLRDRLAALDALPTEE